MKKGSREFNDAQAARMRAWRAGLSEEKKAQIRANQKQAAQRPEVKARIRETRRMRDLFRHHDRRAEKLAYHKAYYRRNKDRMRHQSYKQKFGITLEDYDRMFAEQGGICLICKKPESQRGRMRLAVDHCHRTGKVRGLLCTHCNRGLVYFADEAEFLERAAAYVRERS